MGPEKYEALTPILRRRASKPFFFSHFQRKKKHRNYFFPFLTNMLLLRAKSYSRDVGFSGISMSSQVYLFFLYPFFIPFNYFDISILHRSLIGTSIFVFFLFSFPIILLIITINAEFFPLLCFRQVLISDGKFFLFLLHLPLVFSFHKLFRFLRILWTCELS